jgi:heterodisulfide reductase subunit B
VYLPIVYFTQLLGLAFGLQPKALGLQRNFVVSEPLPAMV